MPPTPRRTVSSGSPYEPLVGLSRAVRVGSWIAVSGTAPIGDDGATVGLGDAEAQARRCFEIALRALSELGGSPADVVRTRALLTDIADWPSVARVHGELFGAIRPASTVMQVSRFIDPEWLVEIELDAVVERPDEGAP